MSTVPVSPINKSADELFDRWLEHWKRENAPLPRTGDEPAAAAAPPTLEARISPMPASPVAAAPPHPRAPSGDAAGLLVLRTLTEHLVHASDTFGPAVESDTRRLATVAPIRPDDHSGERQSRGAILRFPGRSVPTPRPSLTAPWAVPPKAVPAEDRVAAFELRPAPGLILFSPRHGARAVLTAGLVVSLASAALSALAAWLAPSDTTIAVAVVLAIFTGLLWSARHRATGTTVPIDVLGEPGDRGWRVLIQRRGMRPFVVDAGMVDPGELTEAIRRFRPRA